MPRRISHSSPVLASLAGAALLAALALWGVWKSGLGPPRTLIDRSAPDLAPACALLTDAVRVIPEGTTFAVRAEPSDGRRNNWYFRFGVGLLPGRRGVLGKGADYVVVVGPRPQESPGELLLATPDGTVWRRSKS